MRRRVISVLAAALAAALVLAVPASAWEYASGNGYIIRERVEEDGRPCLGRVCQWQGLAAYGPDAP